MMWVKVGSWFFNLDEVKQVGVRGNDVNIYFDEGRYFTLTKKEAEGLISYLEKESKDLTQKSK